MTIQITIIGLGQIGASFGLALANHQKEFLRVGHDKDMSAANEAKKLGAVDKTIRNLPRSVEEADIILLSLPLGEIRETLEYIAKDVREDAIILDTAPAKATVHTWVDELLPGRAYVGLAPAIHYDYLHDAEVGVNAARADLFHKAITMIAAPVTVSETAIKVAVTLTEMVGSQPLFADLAEVDGLNVSAQLLPQLTAAALLEITANHPGWQETRKLAGRAYVEATSPILHHEGAASLAEAAFSSRQVLSYKMDEMIEALQQIKSNLEDKDALLAQLQEAEDSRLLWMRARKNADWLAPDIGPKNNVETPSMLAHLFGFKQRKQKN